MTTYTIDWMSFTIPNEMPRTQDGPSAGRLATWSLAEGVTHWKSEKPRFGYSAAYSPSSCPGPVVFCWPQDGRSHTHVQWSGSALASNGQAWRLLKRAVEDGNRVTRLDLAVDVMAGDPLDVWTAAGREQVLTRLRKRAMVTSDTGITVYLGSRSSGRYVRVYDKAGQLGLPGPWVRVELELKGDDANGTARYIVQEGDHVIPGTVRAVVDCPTLPWWREAFKPHQAVWGAPKIEARPDRSAWIAKQVVPALIGMHRTDPDAFDDTYRRLVSRVGQATGCWPLDFDGHTVDRYNEVSAAADEVQDINPTGR